MKKEVKRNLFKIDFGIIVFRESESEENNYHTYKDSFEISFDNYPTSELTSQVILSFVNIYLNDLDILSESENIKDKPWKYDINTLYYSIGTADTQTKN